MELKEWMYFVSDDLRESIIWQWYTNPKIKDGFM